MTENRVIALDMLPVRAAVTQIAAEPAAEPPAPEPEAVMSAADDRILTRAELGSVYAALLGADLPTADLSEQLRIATPNDHPSPDNLVTALRACGLGARIVRDKSLPADALPALADMTSGQLILVLARAGDTLTIYDPTTPDLRAEVAFADFKPVFTGRLVQARQLFETVEKTHTEAERQPHWFWSEFRRYGRQMFEVAGASLVSNILATAIALYSMQVYDRVIPHQSEPTLWVLTVGAALAVFLDSALRIARAALMDATGRRIELAVQDRLMARLLGMRAAPGERRPSQIFAAMRDFSSVREFFTASTIGTLADLPFLVIFLALVAGIAGNLVWVLLAGGILMVLPGLLMQRRMVALTHATQGASTKAAKLLYEAVFEHETLTTQRGEDRVKRVWSELTTLSAVKSADQRNLTTWLTTWAQAVQQATYILTIMVGAYEVFAGSFTVGTVIAVSMLASRTLAPLAQLSATLARWSNTKAALQGLEAVANAKQIEEPGRQYLRRDRLNGAFELRQTEFKYDPTATPTIDVQALAIPAGQHVAILGANGSGKSTLLRLLAGLYQPTSGRVLIDGVDMTQIHPRDLRRNVGYLGQEVRLFSGTLRANLTMNQLERDDNRLFAALDFAGLGPFVRSHPRGLDLEIREMGEGLSVGQRQSMGWARLWLQDPAIVLLDEPTAALDQRLEATLVSRLGTWLKGRTAVIATHRLPILQLTHRTLILQSGRPAIDGPREAVLAHLAQGAQK